MAQLAGTNPGTEVVRGVGLLWGIERSVSFCACHYLVHLDQPGECPVFIFIFTTTYFYLVI
jgi:hypothetical protein